ncbi:Uncharacterized protein TCAP_05734 [Tolypocladium capitatum]|uniref:DUF7702 domain-containing protein n=1 Tax=Tolypocladium capitatum TaxID=45235 RepID=A0A2K3Q9U2_9HYPO|nr:Uncharacterized protein TCAP_05734 [Tolypocladium capitatum]
MMDAHTALGIAQIIFYVPMVPLAICLMVRNGNIRPRMAWWPLIPFSLSRLRRNRRRGKIPDMNQVRLAGGPIIIALEKNPDNLGLIIAAIILLNVGVIPLIVADLGLTRVMQLDGQLQPQPSLEPHRRSLARRLCHRRCVALRRRCPGLPDLERHAVHRPRPDPRRLFFWMRRSEFLQSSHMASNLPSPTSLETSLDLTNSMSQVLTGSLLASPFIMVRTIYGILEVVFQNDRATKWNPVYGSAVAFAMMALLMEYIALCLYLFTGYYIPPGRGLAASRDAGTPGKV